MVYRVYDYKREVPSFNLTRYWSDLPFLCALAGLNIENCMAGREESNGSTEYLGQILEDRVREIQETGFRVSEPLILSRAISGRENHKKYWEKKGPTLANLLSEIESMAKNLGNFKNLPESTEALGDFYVNLSQEVMAYYKDSRYNHPHHLGRRSLVA